MELREKIARAICGNWVKGDNRPWQAWAEEADDVIEVLRQQKPVAWFEKSPEFDAWFLAYSCNPKAETRALYLAPGVQWGYVRGDAQAVPDGWKLVPTALIDAFPEINTSNYSHDDVCALNAWGIETVLAAAPKPEGK